MPHRGYAPLTWSRAWRAFFQPFSPLLRKSIGGRPAPRGITVEGEVKNYVPVTDAMLRNQDPATG